jgi:hypothetical protein
MDNEQSTQEPIDPEVEEEILRREATADDRSPASLNELKHRAAVSAQQQQ